MLARIPEEAQGGGLGVVLVGIGLWRLARAKRLRLVEALALARRLIAGQTSGLPIQAASRRRLRIPASAGNQPLYIF